MAINFVSSKCACGGKLEYDSVRKVWNCLYCGTTVEREATFEGVHVDGIEGINDVVRQTLMDISYKRIESAERNLTDCERKNHKHIGTLLANLSLGMTKISLAKTQTEARNILEKVKFHAKRLKEEFSEIGSDEINLYESFGTDASDIFANLIIVFETLNETGRIEYISSKMNVGEIFSKEANKSLLKISLKNGHLDMADQIINNINNIDKKEALLEVLSTYPEQDGRKYKVLEKLLSESVILEIEKDNFMNYFQNTADGIWVKNLVLGKIVDAGIHLDASEVLKNFADDFEGYENAKNTFMYLCKSKMTDSEIDALMNYCLMINKKANVVMAYFDALTSNQIFVKFSSAPIISFLDSGEYTIDQTKEILEKMLSFDMDNKAKDAVINYYLCNNTDNYERRSVIIPVLLVEGCPISTTTIENYIISSCIDKAWKVEVIEMIFNTGFNKTFVGDVLSKYILLGKDDGQIKDEITDYLIKIGFKTDAKVLNQYIAGTSDDVEVKEKKLQLLIQNGTQVRPDSLDTYLMNMKTSERFSEKIFKLLTSNSFTVSEIAVCRYLFNCKDICRSEHIIKLLDSVNFDLNKPAAEVQCFNSRIKCNVFQGYLLVSDDDYDVKHVVSDYMNQCRIKLNTEVWVNGSECKFKKFLSENKGNLQESTYRLCEEYKMFSLF